MTDEWWSGRRVFITGHTGFMGGWLTSYLLAHKAEVHGFSLLPPTKPSFFEAMGLAVRMASSVIGDIRDAAALSHAMQSAGPEVVFHLAAQPLVLPAFRAPKETFETNVMGTLNVMEAARGLDMLKSMLLVTTDKVYANRNWHWPYRETDHLGGREPYSASKAASEMVVSAYRHSYFDGIGVASLRVGNIIGGGDWAQHRLIPDAMRCFSAGQPLVLRHPTATRPWQHVLDPLPGYMALAERLSDEQHDYSGGWNLGPASQDCQPVGRVAQLLANAWGNSAKVEQNSPSQVYEETFLALDSSMAAQRLGWSPAWSLEVAIEKTVQWYKAFYDGQDMANVTANQIAAFEQSRMSDAA